MLLGVIPGWGGVGNYMVMSIATTVTSITKGSSQGDILKILNFYKVLYSEILVGARHQELKALPPVSDPMFCTPYQTDI